MGYFFTADQHFSHDKIIEYCNRPFKDVEEMNEQLIKRHNEVVGKNDIIIHAGDFCWSNNRKHAYENYISRLNGNHIFLKGSHDHWLPSSAHEVWEKMIGGIYVVVCHYPMLRWPRSHYNSFLLYGHVHGRLQADGKAWDIGVDNNNYYPVSFERIKTIMATRPDNLGYIKKDAK